MKMFYGKEREEGRKERATTDTSSPPKGRGHPTILHSRSSEKHEVTQEADAHQHKPRQAYISQVQFVWRQ